MELLYLSLFLLQISFSLSSLNTFNPVNTNIKTNKVSKDFLLALEIVPYRMNSLNKLNQ